MSGKYALIIGNNEYSDPGLAQLTAPSKDADDFARVLRDKEIGAFDDVKVVINEPSSSVIEAIDEFFDQKKPDDMLILYFSGHGIRDEIGSLYLAFNNTVRSRLRSTAIKSDYIKEAMDQSRSKRQVLILDCCNSGAFPQGTKAELGGVMGMTKAFQGYGRFVLTASDATQFAWEGDKVIGETDNSLFTHFLVKGLEGDADNDGDGRITVDELYDYAYDQISRVTPKQTPTKSSTKVEGEIVLRQSTRIEDIKPVPLPTPLLDSIENPFPDVRLGAVKQLTKLLNGKNLGLARSAKEALERIVEEDDSRQVSKAATQALDVLRQIGQLDHQKTERGAEERRLATEKAVVEQKAKVAAEEHLAKQKLLVAEKAETERKAREKFEKLEDAQATHNIAESVAKEKSEKEVAKPASIAKNDGEMNEKAMAISGKTMSLQPAHRQRSVLMLGIIGVIGLCIILAGAWGISSALTNRTTPTETKASAPTGLPTKTNSPAAIVATNSPAIKTPTLVTNATMGSPSFQLELCVTSSEDKDICVYTYSPQPTSLIIALIFKQEIQTSSLPYLTIDGQEFNCEILASHPDRLYCSGPSITGEVELVVISSTNQIIASGSFNIPRYTVPSPTPRNNGGNPYP